MLKTILYSAYDISVKGMQKHIAQDRILVLNAEVNIAQPSVKTIQTLQQNAPYAEEITRPTVKAATYIKIYKEQEAKQQFRQGETILNHITQALTSTAITSFLSRTPVNLQSQFQQTSKPPLLKCSYKTSIHPIYQSNSQPS
jgi:hypothetical protein